MFICCLYDFNMCVFVRCAYVSMIFISVFEYVFVRCSFVCVWFSLLCDDHPFLCDVHMCVMIFICCEWFSYVCCVMVICLQCDVYMVLYDVQVCVRGVRTFVYDLHLLFVMLVCLCEVRMLRYDVNVFVGCSCVLYDLNMFFVMCICVGAMFICFVKWNLFVLWCYMCFVCVCVGFGLMFINCCVMCICVCAMFICFCCDVFFLYDLNVF